MLIIRTVSPLEIMSEKQGYNETKKASKVIGLRAQRENLEQDFCKVGFKACRSDKQRDERRAKRK